MIEFNNTAHKILDSAEYYTQTRGFNAFSYKDIQHEVGVKTSSIHYYFPTKQDLALHMVNRYIGRFEALLKTIAQEQDSGIEQLTALSEIFTENLAAGKYCLCGMLSSDLDTLPESAKEKLCHFFNLNEIWIANAIQLAQEQGDVNASLEPRTTAAHFLATLEGGMLIARARGRVKYLEVVITQSLILLRT